MTVATAHPQGVERLRSIITRRSHKKSRAGCLACKARRIKCGEEKPTCQNCVTRSRSKTCEYPSPINYGGPPFPVPGPQKSISAVAEAGADAFTLRDLRLFHHFLGFAYPSLPLGNQSIWTQDVPQLIFSHHYLMYALLALGASHLGSLTAHDHNTDAYTALAHRGHAISGLKMAFKQAQHSSVESDAMLATCYALAFQSALMPNGYPDFATFVRGCAIVTEKIQYAGRGSIFNLPGDLCRRCPTSAESTGDLIIAFSMGPRSSLNPLLEDGVNAFAALQTSVAPHDAERGFRLAIYSTFVALQDSPGAGYSRFLSFYAVWFKLAEDTLHFTGELISVTEQLLWAFFVSLQLFIVLMVDESIAEEYPAGTQKDEAMIGKQAAAMIEWLEALSLNTPSPVSQHLEWPKRVTKNCVRRFELAPPSPAKVHQKVVILQHLDVSGHILLGSILDLSASLTNWTEGIVKSQRTLGGRLGKREETRRAPAANTATTS